MLQLYKKVCKIIENVTIDKSSAKSKQSHLVTAIMFFLYIWSREFDQKNCPTQTLLMYSHIYFSKHIVSVHNKYA
jgi:hypothetical protein